MQVHRPGMARVKLCARIGSTGLISLALCADRSSRIFSADVVTDDRDEMVCGFFSSRSEEHTSELQSLMRISYAVFCLTTKTTNTQVTDKRTLTRKSTAT